MLPNSQSSQTTWVQSASVTDNEAGYLGCWLFSYLHCIPASMLEDAELLRGRTTCSSTGTTPPSLVAQAKVLWCLQSVLEHLFSTLCETAVPKIIIWRTFSLGSRSRGSDLRCDPSVPTKCEQRGCRKFSLTFFKSVLCISFSKLLRGFACFNWVLV